MKKSLWTLGLALVGMVALACSDTGRSSSPVAPESSNLTAVIGAVQAKGLICHHNPDIDDGDPEWVTIEVANGSKYLSKHPGDCELFSGVVGEACSCAATVLSSVTAASKAPKYDICHFDVDDEELYDSIVITVNGNSVDSHFANHGDCYTSDPVGTEDCSCTI